MNTVPRLTIGLPVYNGRSYLSEALDALLDQTYTDFELIISDNASTDGTEEICRRYVAMDPRIRYIRQPRNIGAAPNHNVVVNEARGELFKWAAHDDLYSPDLLERCIAALDGHPEVVLASCLSVMIDGAGKSTEPVTDYPVATDSPRPSERFASVLFGRGGDDDYGVIRTEVLRRTPLTGSHYHSDRTLVAELALQGPFHRIPETLYFRRDLPDRAGTPQQSVRSWCVTHDPRRADHLRHPTIRLLGEYVWAFADAIRRAPLAPADKRRCYGVLADYLSDRIRPGSLRRAARERTTGPGPRPESVPPSRRRSREAVLSTFRDGVRGHRWRTVSVPRVGLFGLLGAGNVGNDGSLEVVLAYLRAEHPDAVLGALCSGPERVTERYGVPATRLHWYRSECRTASGVRAITLKVLGKVVDAGRTLSWVRRQDVVIVPGMGVLETTLPLRPWGYPYSLLCLCASARLVGTRVALVSVGANIIPKRAIRWVITRAASFAHYRSYRDALSRDAMRDMGVDVTADEVYPDLAFALPVPAGTSTSVGAVGVGVMAYHGGNDDRRHAGDIHRAYVDTMKRFVRWLVDGGRQVRLFTGDKVDESVVADILADLRAHRPDLDRSRVVAEPASDLQDLMRQMATVDTVVATRYHNVLCALKLSKPTLSLGYATKNDVLMARMGLAEFCQPARSIDFERFTEQFQTLESRREQLVETMEERNRANVARLDHQFTALSATLFPEAESGVPVSIAGGVS